MTPDATRFSRRAVAAGMACPPADRVVGYEPRRWAELEDGRARYLPTGSLWVSTPYGWLPDLDDDATKGVALGQVRRRWGEPTATLVYQAPTHLPGPGCDGGWDWIPETIREAVGGPASTEVEALVVALEAASRKAA